MAFLSQKRIKEIIENAPPGTTPEGIISELRKRGNILEGFDEAQIGQREMQQKIEDTTLGKIGNFFGKALDIGGKFTGAKKLAELSEPIVELGLSKLPSSLPKEQREKILLTPEPASISAREAEKGGLKEGIRQIGGQAAQAAAGMAPFVAGGLGTTGLTGKGKGLIGFANSFVGRSAEISFAKSVGESLQKKESAGKLLVGASVKGATAAAISFVIGTTMNKIVSSLQRRASRVTGRALKPSIRNLQKDIEKGRKTINDKIVAEGYRGTNEGIRKQAVSNMQKYGNEIDKAIQKASKGTEFKGTVFKKAIIKEFDKLLEKNIVLDDSQLKLIQKQLDKIPRVMSVEQANQFKQQFARLVPPRAWDSAVSDIDTFRAQLFKTLSGGFRKQVEQKIPLIRGINEKWSIALDVLGLSSNQLARAQGSGGLAEIVRGGPFSSAIRGITSPFTATVTRTTRAQVMNALSKIGRNDLIRELGKILIIKKESQ